ncbi:uncharacterized protein LOC112392374 [Neophocaena asiaeorientalis asiaeorientalis]|uniref:Uncharacterized protein LOC112392374 n=1 Tax=Neophocaena asiaeorientalis asiaeorientalis TaxID=1706337 RepID=A0A341AGN0_NEOAA|nr:uncharacterized protein LOC112392374 [Neophocaena asiaeorientalis asiaeorientalis]
MPAILPGESGAAPEGGGLGLPGCVARLLEDLDGGLRAPPLTLTPRSAPQLPGLRHQMAADALRSLRLEAAPGGAGARASGGHLRRALWSGAASSRRPPGLRRPRPVVLVAGESAPTPARSSGSGLTRSGAGVLIVLVEAGEAQRASNSRGEDAGTSGEQEAGGQARPGQRSSQRSLWTVSSHCWLCCRLDPVGGGRHPTRPSRKLWLGQDQGGRWQGRTLHRRRPQPGDEPEMARSAIWSRVLV